jgi:hypothetical protein
MKIVGIMLARNEDWIIGCSARAALRWVDQLLVCMDRCTDGTAKAMNQLIIEEARPRSENKRVSYMVPVCKDDGQGQTNWDEMDIRDSTLTWAREESATHIAIIDADEILTANNVPYVRDWFRALKPGQCLDLPMIPVWRSLEKYRTDECVWKRAKLTLGFMDSPDLTHKPRQGYHHHNRPPAGCRPDRNTVDCEGGVMHLQWASWDRVVAKHRWYVMMEATRYKGRRTPAQLNKTYGQALDERGCELSDVPKGWWDGHPRQLVNLQHHPWYVGECERMWKEHGAEAFKGLNLWGWPDGD